MFQTTNQIKTYTHTLAYISAWHMSWWFGDLCHITFSRICWCNQWGHVANPVRKAKTDPPPLNNLPDFLWLGCKPSIHMGVLSYCFANIVAILSGWYEFASWDDDIPNRMGKIKVMFQTTNQMNSSQNHFSLGDMVKSHEFSLDSAGSPQIFVEPPTTIPYFLWFSYGFPCHYRL